MFYYKGTDHGTILKALAMLKAGDPESYVTAQLDTKLYDSIQAVKNKNGTYLVEVLVKGGDPAKYSGNKIFAVKNVPVLDALRLFADFLKKGDNMPLPSGAKEMISDKRWN